MDQAAVYKRVETMEMTLQTLRAIPGRIASIDVQLLQFREEVRVELTAMHREMRALHAMLTDRDMSLHEGTKVTTP